MELMVRYPLKEFEYVGISMIHIGNEFFPMVASYHQGLENVLSLDEFLRRVEFAFLSVCPTGWRSAPDLSIKLGRLAVETGVFPLFEVEKGQYRLSIDFPKLRPVKEYLRLQGQFRHLTDEMIEEIEREIHEEYKQLRERTTNRPAKLRAILR